MSTLDHLFLSACESGNLQEMKRILQTSPDLDPNTPSGPKGKLPLIESIRSLSPRAVSFLLRSLPSIDPNLPDSSGQTPLIAAIRSGFMDLLEALLADQRVDLNRSVGPENEQVLPLLLACQLGDPQIVRRLVRDQRLDVNQGFPFRSAIRLACKMGYSEIAVALLEHPKIQVDGESMLGFACKWRESRIAELLVKQVNMNPKAVSSYLAHSCQIGDAQIAAELLKFPGVDPNIIADSMNPLFTACVGGHSAVVKVLLRSEYYIDTKCKCSRNDEPARTPAEFAAEFSCVADSLFPFEPTPKAQARRQKFVEISNEINLYELKQDAAALFATMIFFCDGFLQLGSEREKEQNSNQAERFLKISEQLPMDLQMVLSNRIFSLPTSFIPIRYTEVAFRRLVSLYH